MVGKTLVLSPDQSAYKGNADGLKRATGGDLITVKNLYSNPFDYRPNIVFVYSTNEHIYFTDKNGGIARRRVIISFDRKVPPEQVDEYFPDKVKREIYAIVHKLLNAFPDPNRAKETLKTFQAKGEGLHIKKSANHLINFATHFDVDNERRPTIIWGSNRTTKNEREAIYKAYIEFCECQNQKPLNLSVFKQAFSDALKEIDSSATLKERIRDGYTYLNVHWKDYHATIRQWRDG